MDASTDVAGAGGAAPVAAPLPDLRFRRILQAPVPLVFRAWTSSGCVAAWWGPHGSSTPFTAIEPWPGGRFHVHTQEADGSIRPMGGHVVEIEAPTRIVFVTTLADEDGTVVEETLHTVTLADRGDRTEMNLHARSIRAAPFVPRDAERTEEVWSQSLERLAAILKAI